MAVYLMCSWARLYHCQSPRNAGIYGGTPSVGGYDPGRSGYAPPGAGFPSNAGGSDDKVSPGGSGEYGPQAGASAGKGSGGGNKMFLAIVIPLIAVILAALTIIFIFVIYPEIAGDPGLAHVVPDPVPPRVDARLLRRGLEVFLKRSAERLRGGDAAGEGHSNGKLRLCKIHVNLLSQSCGYFEALAVRARAFSMLCPSSRAAGNEKTPPQRE